MVEHDALGQVARDEVALQLGQAGGQAAEVPRDVGVDRHLEVERHAAVVFEAERVALEFGAQGLARVLTVGPGRGVGGGGGSQDPPVVRSGLAGVDVPAVDDPLGLVFPARVAPLLHPDEIAGTDGEAYVDSVELLGGGAFTVQDPGALRPYVVGDLEALVAHEQGGDLLHHVSPSFRRAEDLARGDDAGHHLTCDNRNWSDWIGWEVVPASTGPGDLRTVDGRASAPPAETGAERA